MTSNSLRALAAALCTAGLALHAGAATMAKAEYEAAKTRIEADHKVDRAACDRLSGNGKDICVEEAKAKEKVAKAELEARRSGKPEDRAKVAEVRADAAYEVAEERCEEHAGNAKDVCMREAKAAHVRAKADAKAGHRSMEAIGEANKEKRDADYKVEMERCDALAGDAKDACRDTAKSHYGKH